MNPTGREDELGADVNCSRTGVPSFGRGLVRLCRDCSRGVWASFQTWAFILEVMGCGLLDHVSSECSVGLRQEQEA